MPAKREPPKRKYTPPHNYTAAEIRFLEKKVAGRSYAELTELFNKHFGLRGKKKRTASQIGSTVKRYGMSNGRDTRFHPGQVPPNKGKKGYCHPGSEKGWFKPGNTPHNWHPVGTEVMGEDGYIKVKTRNPKTWKFKHRLIWEKANGKIPSGGVIIFADGNRRNFRLNNLLLISRSELSVMNHLGLISDRGKLTEIGKTIADIKLLIAERKREIKKQNKRARGRPKGEKK
jgi:hypothetical protein